MREYMEAGIFEGQCLKVLEHVKRTKRTMIITKRDIPIAQILPMKEKGEELYGKMRGTIHIKRDMIKSIGEEWDANH